MFSFRTTPVQDQLDKALREGRVGCFCAPSCFKPSSMSYVYDIFRERGNLERIFCPSGGEFSSGDSHIGFDLSVIEGLDAIVVDFQDSGARGCSLTTDFISLMDALDKIENAPAMYVVDHPNPAGRIVEGTMPEKCMSGIPRVAHRHGLTVGEIAFLHHSEGAMKYPLHVISASCDESVSMMPWTIPPSADFPGFFTAWMQSGGCLWKHTNVTPGIGTPRPYEYIGAPFVKAGFGAPVPSPHGVVMRPCSFTPAYGLYAGTVCCGYQIILQPSLEYHNLLHTLDLMRCFMQEFPEFSLGPDFADALSDSTLLSYVKGGIGFEEVREYMKTGEQKWTRRLKKFTLYSDEPCRMK